MRHLCVGGPHDGTWCEVNGERMYIQRVVHRELCSSFDANSLNPVMPVYPSVHTYGRMQWRTDYDTNRYIYVHTDIDKRDVFDMLLNGYKRNGNAQ